MIQAHTGDVVATRQLGGWTIRLAKRMVQQHGGVRRMLWQIVASHPQRDTMVFVYGGEKDAKEGFTSGTEAQLYEAACMGKVLS